MPKSAIRGGMVASAANAGFDLESFDAVDGPRWSKMTSSTTRRGVGIPQMVVVRGQSAARSVATKLPDLEMPNT